MADEDHAGLTGERERRSPWFWPLAVAGWAVMAYAVRGILVQDDLTNPWELAKLLVGLDVVHDLLVAPVVVVIGVALARWLPRAARAPVQAGLVITAIVALYAYPFLRGYGRSATAGASRLPNNYASGVIVVVIAVWVAILGGVLVRWAIRRR